MVIVNRLHLLLLILMVLVMVILMLMLTLIMAVMIMMLIVMMVKMMLIVMMVVKVMLIVMIIVMKIMLMMMVVIKMMVIINDKTNYLYLVWSDKQLKALSSHEFNSMNQNSTSSMSTYYLQIIHYYIYSLIKKWLLIFKIYNMIMSYYYKNLICQQ